MPRLVQEQLLKGLAAGFAPELELQREPRQMQGHSAETGSWKSEWHWQTFRLNHYTEGDHSLFGQ